MRGEGDTFLEKGSPSPPLMLPPFPSKNFYQEAAQDMAGLLTGLRRVRLTDRDSPCLVLMREKAAFPEYWLRERCLFFCGGMEDSGGDTFLL